MRDLSQLEVCFIAGTLGQGGAERQLFYILKVLRQCGTRVRVLSLTRGEYWEQRIRDLGIQVKWVGQPESKFARLCRVVSALREQPPHIFQSQHFYTNLYAVAAARALRLHDVGAIRNDGKSELRHNGRFFGNLSLRFPRTIAANSKAGIRNAIDLGVNGTRLHLLPNVVNCDEFKSTPRQRTGPLRLLLVGRLVEQKRVDRFLAILSSLRRRSNMQFEALIVGDGPLQAELERQAQEMGLLPNVVRFEGVVADMSAVYRAADVLVLTSDHEGTPNVLLEAMASGLPVVATRVGGVAEIVKHTETGYLAEPEDQDALADALLQIMENENVRRELGARAREYVIANHSMQRLPAHLQELYEATLS